MAKLTPMMQQYMNIKDQHKDCILFYRLGDFYEMFFDDAITASKELEITLTGKNCGLDEKAPMCGVPYHSMESYLNKLVSKGYKVGICEQTEDASMARGLVKREVVRIVTPGTNLNTDAMEEGKNHYIMCIVQEHSRYGVAVADVTTGDFLLTEVETERKLVDEIHRFMPKEIACEAEEFLTEFDLEDMRNRLGIAVSILDKAYFQVDMGVQLLKEHYETASLEGLGLSDYTIGVTASGALLRYLIETQKNALTHMNGIRAYASGAYMLIDSATRRNLELTETLREKQKRGSLLWVLDKTKTAMGARCLRSYLEQPLLRVQDINDRLDAIGSINSHFINREEVREYLNSIYDLERLVGRISYKTANPRDLIAFKLSLEMLPHIRLILEEHTGALLEKVRDDLDPLEELCALIDQSIMDEPPVSVREGNIVKTGYHKEIDTYRRAATEGKQWIADLETKEKEKTGIRNLRIKFNKVFGYYIEVTNSYSHLVPTGYIRKQTVANAERYVTEELKELETTILGAEDKLITLEYDLFCQVRDAIGLEIKRIQTTAKAIATLDALVSMAAVSDENGYVRPVVAEDGVIEIKEGRHPVVEKMISHQQFIANDTFLDQNNSLISIITGPNMAGKSTYMRQAALIVLMAQIGCYVPAGEAHIGIVDRIFTRVGASDDLASGQSTFMVEMTEVANILRNATPNSLLILDEIGRGTSTFDGMSIAWAVLEYISFSKQLGAKTLFATHYHELTELEGKLAGVNNYCIAVKEQGEDIVFLRKIIRGGADKSYGIQVAKIAGVPEEIILRANALVDELSDNDIVRRAKEIQVAGPQNDLLTGKTAKTKSKEIPGQMSLFVLEEENSIISEIRALDVNSMTPVEALQTLYSLQEKVKGT